VIGRALCNFGIALSCCMPCAYTQPNQLLSGDFLQTFFEACHVLRVLRAPGPISVIANVIHQHALSAAVTFRYPFLTMNVLCFGPWMASIAIVVVGGTHSTTSASNSYVPVCLCVCVCVQSIVGPACCCHSAMSVLSHMHPQHSCDPRRHRRCVELVLEGWHTAGTCV
jgi:hypothetical protein